MFTCKIPSPYNPFCKINSVPPLINRSRTHVYAKYKTECTPRAHNLQPSEATSFFSSQRVIYSEFEVFESNSFTKSKPETYRSLDVLLHPQLLNNIPIFLLKPSCDISSKKVTCSGIWRSLPQQKQLTLDYIENLLCSSAESARC